MECSTAQRIFGSDTVTTVMDVESDLLSFSTGGRISNRQDRLAVLHVCNKFASTENEVASASSLFRLRQLYRQ